MYWKCVDGKCEIVSTTTEAITTSQKILESTSQEDWFTYRQKTCDNPTWRDFTYVDTSRPRCTWSPCRLIIWGAVNTAVWDKVKTLVAPLRIRCRDPQMQSDTGVMTYSESIIIPLSLLKQCRFEEQLAVKTTDGSNTVQHLLHNPRLSSSEKINLINHEEVLKKSSRLEYPPAFSSATRVNKDILLKEIQNKYRPQANAVLEFILDHQNDVSWDPNTYRVKVKGIVLEDSNMRDISLTLMNAAIITRDEDISTGTFELYDVLVKDLGMPKSWIPASIASRSSKRIREDEKKAKKGGHSKKKPAAPYGMGLTGWIAY